MRQPTALPPLPRATTANSIQLFVHGTRREAYPEQDVAVLDALESSTQERHDVALPAALAVLLYCTDCYTVVTLPFLLFWRYGGEGNVMAFGMAATGVPPTR